MKKEQLSQAMNNINLRYIEEADNFSVKKNKKIFSKMKWAAVAACAALIILIGNPILNYATGLYHSVNSYFEGETEFYMEEILSHVTSVSNEQLELRVEGLIADEHICYMIVSFIGLTDEMEARLLRGDLEEQELFETYAVLSNGEYSLIPSGSMTHTENIMGGRKRKAVSMIPDAHATYVITYQFDENNLAEMQAIGFSYEGLTLEVDANDYLAPMYRLESADGTGNLTDAYISSMGYGFTYHFDEPLSEEAVENMDIVFEVKLIRADGSVLTREEMAQIGSEQDGGCMAGDTETDVRGYWKRTMPVIINLEEYCGLQVDGVNYYFAVE